MMLFRYKNPDDTLDHPYMDPSPNVFLCGKLDAKMTPREWIENLKKERKNPVQQQLQTSITHPSAPTDAQLVVEERKHDESMTSIIEKFESGEDVEMLSAGHMAGFQLLFGRQLIDWWGNDLLITELVRCSEFGDPTEM